MLQNFAGSIGEFVIQNPILSDSLKFSVPLPTPVVYINKTIHWAWFGGVNILWFFQRSGAHILQGLFYYKLKKSTTY